MKNIILIVFYFCMISCQKENQSIDNNLLKKENILLQKKNDSLKERVKIAEEAITILQRDVWYDPENDNTDFKKKGIVDSENFIIDGLMKRPELIPLKSTLGGKMSFSNIKLLGSTYLIAFYEDGHVEGKSIYSYKLTGSNNLEFKIVVSE